MSDDEADPSQFYTGLIAELYEPLAGGIGAAEPYIKFVRRYGEPALEVCCGSGRPMLELLDCGLAVEGLDSSTDMLALCRTAAAETGVVPVLHHATMQDFDLARTYQCIFIANGSITLLLTDEDLCKLLSNVQRHLEPGSALLVDLDIPNVAALQSAIGQFKETEVDGVRLRVGMTGLEVSEDQRNLAIELCYQRIQPDGSLETVTRIWHRRSWNLDQFSVLLDSAGFSVIETAAFPRSVVQVIATVSGYRQV